VVHRRRRVRSVLSGCRLLAALSLVLVVPVSLGLAAATAGREQPPPAPVDGRHQALPQAPDRAAVAALDRSTRVDRLSRGFPGPRLLPASAVGGGASDLPTVALARRATPYTLAEVRELLPAAFADVDAGGRSAVLVAAHLSVPVGATLVVDGRTPDVRLTSSPLGFATLISRGTVLVRGDAAAPVRISSWNPDLGRPDLDSADGRSFVLQLGGRMDATNAAFEYLGFGTGNSSGVAWRGATAADTGTGTGTGTERIKAAGEVRSTLFAHNHFGAYTHEAQGMAWLGNTFSENEEYGFDPHDYSNDFLVQGNVAHHNGRHGFIFSRGTDRNVLRANNSYANRGHGFMIDDGRSDRTAIADRRVDPADDNLVVDNIATGNGLSGVEIEGGTGNVVAGNRLIGNYIGVRVNNRAAVTVTSNTISGSYRYGIDVLDSAGRIPITHNTISGSWAAINIAAAGSAALANNTISDVTADTVVDGVAEHSPSWYSQAARFLRWNPMLALWGLLLGVPIIVGLARTVHRPRATSKGPNPHDHPAVADPVHGPAGDPRRGARRGRLRPGFIGVRRPRTVHRDAEPVRSRLAAGAAGVGSDPPTGDHRRRVDGPAAAGRAGRRRPGERDSHGRRRLRR
jgi:parallel beta-helix repeat protein